MNAICFESELASYLLGGNLPIGLMAPEVAAVYRQVYHERLNAALQNRYPCLAQIVGLDRFTDMAAAYIDKFPADQPVLNQYGQRLPGLLEHCPDLSLQPYLADLARYEYLLGDLSQQLPSISVSPLTRLHLFSSPWAVAALYSWWAHGGRGDFVCPPGALWMALWSGAKAPDHIFLDQAQYTYLSLLRNGAAPATAETAAARVDASFDADACWTRLSMCRQESLCLPLCRGAQINGDAGGEEAGGQARQTILTTSRASI